MEDRLTGMRIYEVSHAFRAVVRQPIRDQLHEAETWRHSIGAQGGYFAVGHYRETDADNLGNEDERSNQFSLHFQVETDIFQQHDMPHKLPLMYQVTTVSPSTSFYNKLSDSHLNGLICEARTRT